MQVKSPEFRLLLEIIRPDMKSGTSKESIADLVRQVEDWSSFITLCHNHGLMGIAAACIAENFSSLIPLSAQKKIHDLSVLNAARSMAQSAILLKTIDLFNGSGIEALPFKGPVLAQQLYGNLGLRSFSDLDILVKKEDVKQAVILLIEHGYTPEIADISNRAEEFTEHEDNLSLSRAGDASIIELHWDMGGCYLPEAITYQDVASENCIMVGSRLIPSMAAEDLLIYLCVHGTKHIWERLEWLYSLAIMLQRLKGLNWPQIIARAEEWQCLRILFLGLELTSQLFRSRLPEEIQDMVKNDKAVGRLAKKVKELSLPDSIDAFADKRRQRFSSFHLNTRSTKMAGLFYGMRLLFRPTVKEWLAWPLPKGLTFLYYPLRPVRLIWLKLRIFMTIKI